MLDLKLIRENSQFVSQALSRRNGGFSITKLLEVDEDYRRVQADWEELNRRTNEISERFKTGKVPSDEAASLKQETKEIKSKRETIEARRNELEQALRHLQMALPNLPDASVPDGHDETANREVSRWGELPKIENPLNHFELGAELDIFDFERGVKLAESRFTVLMPMGAKI